jgi:AI-2 transport protein TqsA
MTLRLREEQAWLITVASAIVGVLAIGLMLNYMRPVLIPFVLALFITSIVAPLVDLQVSRLRFPRVLAVFNTLVVLILIFTAFGLIILKATQDAVSSVRAYSEGMANLGADLLDQVSHRTIEISLDDITRRIREELPRWATSTASNIFGFFARGVLVFIFVGFLLAGRNPHIVNRGVYADIDRQIRRYLGTKVVISAVTGVLVWLWLRFIDLELASLFGLLAFILNFIPSLGSIIATLLPIPTAVVQFEQDYGKFASVLIVPGMLQMLIGNVIEPKLLGDGLKLHPVVILLALAIWGLLWGPAGMLLAVPITAVIRIVLDQFSITRPASELLGGTLPGMQTRPKNLLL